MQNLSWTAIEARVNGLTQRERIILLVFLTSIMLGAWDALYLSRSMMEHRHLVSRSMEMTQNVGRIDEQIEPLKKALAAGNDVEARARMELMQSRRLHLERDISAASARLVTAANMNDVLDILVRERPGLMLNALRTLPVKAVNLGTKADPLNLYEHAVEISVSGSFSAIRDYLRDIEDREARLVWDSLQFARTDSDKGTVKLVVRTLGRDEAFIQVRP
jgi:MSHA biogenesis protein MshJ